MTELLWWMFFIMLLSPLFFVGAVIVGGISLLIKELTKLPWLISFGFAILLLVVIL